MFENKLLRTLKNALPDRLFLIVQFWCKTGRMLNLSNPRMLTEKIGWLKLYYKRNCPDESELGRYIDKYEVREYVRERIGEKYLNGIHGLYSSPEEIDPDALPDRFVLKATHGSGMVLICTEKRTFDWEHAVDVMEQWLETDWYSFGREWGYGCIKPRLLSEQYLDSDQGLSPDDYKFYCFHGSPQFVQLDKDRVGDTTRTWYDTEWNLLPVEGEYPPSVDHIRRPVNFSTMLSVAEALAQPFPFVRVDLYSVRNNIIFGELTFYPGRGLSLLEPIDYEWQFGDYLQLPIG